MMLTSKQLRVIDRALMDAAGMAQTDRQEHAIFDARRALLADVRSSATPTAVIERVRRAARIWGHDAWVLDEVEASFAENRDPDFAGIRDRRRRA
jgi:hypothetical protein